MNHIWFFLYILLYSFDISHWMYSPFLEGRVESPNVIQDALMFRWETKLWILFTYCDYSRNPLSYSLEGSTSQILSCAHNSHSWLYCKCHLYLQSPLLLFPDLIGSNFSVVSTQHIVTYHRCFSLKVPTTVERKTFNASLIVQRRMSN